MKKLLLIILLLGVISADAQTFYITPTPKNYGKKIREKMLYDGYKLTDSVQNADYQIDCFIKQLFPAGGIMGPSYKGYVKVSSLKNGDEIGHTHEVKRSPAALNGYNAADDIFRVIAKKYLSNLLDKCKQQYASK